MSGHDIARWEQVRARVKTPTDPDDLPGTKPPTRESLERHAERFGPDQVKETAAERGLNVTVPSVTAPRKSKR